MKLHIAIVVCIGIAITLNGALAALEDCPTNCGPTHDVYGKACGTVNGTPQTFRNLCVLFMQRCANKNSGGPVIEFRNDGPC